MRFTYGVWNSQKKSSCICFINCFFSHLVVFVHVFAHLPFGFQMDTGRYIDNQVWRSEFTEKMQMHFFPQLFFCIVWLVLFTSSVTRFLDSRQRLDAIQRFKYGVGNSYKIPNAFFFTNWFFLSCGCFRPCCRSPAFLILERDQTPYRDLSVVLGIHRKIEMHVFHDFFSLVWLCLSTSSVTCFLDSRTRLGDIQRFECGVGNSKKNRNTCFSYFFSLV